MYTSSSPMKDISGIARFMLEIWRLRSVRGCIGGAICPLSAEVKVNFALLPRQKAQRGSTNMAMLFL